jgi:hypothetical protein
LPEGLRAAVENAARRDGASLNSWLVRAAAAASNSAGHSASDEMPGHSHRNAHRLTGWAR